MKSAGTLKDAGIAYLALFFHGTVGEMATAAPMGPKAASEVTALGSSLSHSTGELSALSPGGRVVTQVLVRIPGHEREQLASLVGDQRDRFLVLVCQEEIRAFGLETYLRGTFRDWAPGTVVAFRHRGLPWALRTPGGQR